MKRIAIPSLVMLVLGFAVAASLADTPPALKVTELGRGPAIVMVHGIGSGRLQWMPTARKLIGNHHVVLVDLPGHGDSPMLDPFSFNAAAAALSEVIAHQKAESTIVVGQGVGGTIALLAVSQHPERQRGLIVIDGATKLPQPIPDQQMKYFFDYLETNYEAVMKPMFVGQGRDSAQGAALWAQASLVPPASMKPYMHEFVTADVSKQMKELKVPLLYIGSEKVWPADKSWADLAKSIGYDEAVNLDTRRIAGAGAMIASEQPDTLAMVIHDFSARVVVKK